MNKVIKKRKIPVVSVCWLMTSLCNYKCDFCFKVGGQMNLSYFEAEKILKKLANAGIRKISFSGGEPLLWPGIEKLIKKAKSLGIITMMITNGSLLNKKRLKEFEKYLDWLTLPLDGSNKQIQKNVGRPEKHFAHTIKLIQLLKKSPIKVKINTVLCKINLNDIVNIAKLIKKYPVYRWKVFQFFSIRDASIKFKTKYEISLKDFNKAEKKVKPLFKNQNCLVYFGSNTQLGTSYFTIAPNGTVYISTNGKDQIIGDLKKQSVEKIWDSNNLFNKTEYYKRASWILK